MLYLAFGFNLQANEVIKFTWAGGGGNEKALFIVATANKEFTIDWGNGIIETKKGTGDVQRITFYYDSFDSFQVIITGSSVDCVFATFGCSNMRVIDLDLSGCTKLQLLGCALNQLTSLDLSKCVALKKMDCYGNRLTSLDLSANVALTHVWCYENQLTTLNVNGCTALIQLSCSENRLTELDLSANIALESLGCANNRLTNLDLSSNPALKGFACENNQLSRLDVSHYFALEGVHCYNNRLSLSDLYTISKKISNLFDRRLGTQTLVPQAVDPGSSVDFSDQAAFEGVATVFEVQKDGSPATISDDYTISAGIITFNEVGNYTVTMTNSAIVANDYYPAKVIAQFWVGIESIKDVAQTPEVLIYPNPTTGKVYIKTENEPAPEVKLYSTDGKLLQHVRNTEIEMSGYDAGVYYLQVDEKMMKIIKK